MSQLALAIREPRTDPTDPELWDALRRPFPFSAACKLLKERHGSDRDAWRREVEGFRPPDAFDPPRMSSPLGGLATLRTSLGLPGALPTGESP